MVDLKWYTNRLRAMQPAEVAWRIQQKMVERIESRRFSVQTRIDERVFKRRLDGIKADWSRLPLNLANNRYSLAQDITLLGPYAYNAYCNQWSAGFQTDNEWPVVPSHLLSYKQRDDVGDARTNWELNRGLQFALLAKDYYVSHDATLLDGLSELFESWCKANPFLWGISWVSVMEVAIRCINWMYAAAFLAGTDGLAAAGLSEKFEIGAANMAVYVAAHYSRYSSSNNHAIVEACALGLAGFVYNNGAWSSIASRVLETEVPRQNFSDGVNREQCLHYQVFFMEAVGLYLLACHQNGLAVPKDWPPLLACMADYVHDCRVKKGVWLEFGDDDEGVILSLGGSKPDCYEYVLQLMSIVLDADRRWSDYDSDCENIRWLCPANSFDTALAKPLHDNSKSITYPMGGVTIIRSTDGRVVLGMDHGPLGFGTIAAHGHADALSIQLYVDGECVIGDPGTYIYHSDLTMRNEFRRTRSHSTVCVGHADQSEMLGAFMWGKRFKCELLSIEHSGDGSYAVSASHDGYAPVIHVRSVHFDGNRKFEIFDTLGDSIEGELVFVIPPKTTISESAGGIVLSCGGASVTIAVNEEIPIVEPIPYSTAYGFLEEGSRVVFSLVGAAATKIEVNAPC